MSYAFCACGILYFALATYVSIPLDLSVIQMVCFDQDRCRTIDLIYLLRLAYLFQAFASIAAITLFRDSLERSLIREKPHPLVQTIFSVSMCTHVWIHILKETKTMLLSWIECALLFVSVAGHMPLMSSCANLSVFLQCCTFLTCMYLIETTFVINSISILYGSAVVVANVCSLGPRSYRRCLSLLVVSSVVHDVHGLTQWYSKNVLK